MAKAIDGGMEFQDALLEQRGAMAKGRLKFSDSAIVFKNNRTGKVEQIQGSDIDVVTWQRFAGHWGIRLFTKSGTLHRLGGFRDSDKDKIAKNDDAPVSLMELRFHIPSSELAGDDPVENFKDQVMGKASIISATGDAIAIFREIQCLTHRGRYDIKIFQQFFQLHGKTFDYKIAMSTVLRLFLLPHKDGRQMFYMISLDPPIKQGQTRYHYLTFLFAMEDDDVTIELPMSEEELKKKFDGKLEKELNGPLYEVISKVMKTLVSRKITTPGSFKGSFDFEIETKNSVVHTFSSIEKEEYHKLFDFITDKKLRVKNRGKLDNQPITGDFDDSDAEAEPDAYLARVKAEAQERSDDSGESESEDEDYNPDGDAKKVAAEGSAGSSVSGISEDEGTDPDEIGSDMDTSPKKKKEKKAKKARRDGDSSSSRKKKSKRDKDPDAPKRPMSAYFLWMNTSREALKKKWPGLTITEFSKKCGEEWKKIDDKAKWEAKAKKAKEIYDEQMIEYKKNGGGAKASSSKSSKSTNKSPKKSSSETKSGSGGQYKSKEFISDSESSDDEKGSKAKKRADKKESGSKAKSKSKKKESESEAEASESGSGSGSGSDD